MGLFDMFLGGAPAGNDQAMKHYEDFYVHQQPHHESSLTHEGLAAAAGFAAMHAYEAHVRASGQEVSHAKMKEFLAACAAAEVDKLVETKGLDWVDRRKAHKMAEQQAHHLADQRYGSGNSGWEYARGREGPRQEYQFGRGGGWQHEGYGGYGGGGGGFGGGRAGFGGGGGFGGDQGGFGGGGYGGDQGGFGGGGRGYEPSYEGGQGYGGGPQPGYGGGGGYGGQDGYGGGGPGYGGPGYGEGGYPPPPPPQGYGGGYNQPEGYGGYEGGPPPGEYGEGRHHRHHHRRDD